MNDNVTAMTRVDPELAKELDAAVERHPAGSARVKPEPKKNATRTVYDDRREIKDIQKRVREQKIQRYERQETKRATRMQIDQNVTLWLLVGLAAVTFVTSAILTAAGTVDVAIESMQLPAPWMALLVFGAIEVAILVFLLVYILRGSRGQSAGHWFFAMIGAASVTVAAQIYHVARGHNFDLTNPDLYAGTILAVVIALSFVLVSKAVAGSVFSESMSAEDFE